MEINAIWFFFYMVGMTGFEPATSSSRTKRTTKLCYIPKNFSRIKYTAILLLSQLFFFQKTKKKQTLSRMLPSLFHRFLDIFDQLIQWYFVM